MHTITRFAIATFAALTTCAALGEVKSSAPRYTFSWPLDEHAPTPRGGTTKGAPVVLDTASSREWQALQAPALTALERDRRAILAMAGAYRVTFDFLEVANYAPNSTRDAPYQSWGTEKVYVDRDDGVSISLVHILEMRVLHNDGSLSEPTVIKHWRQDWQYEPTHIVEYRGHHRWERRKLAPAETRGKWLQTVYQVDDSPRYASLGVWEHSASFSTWLSADTWRPLPRREWSVHNDYHVLIGTNRHTVYANGWLQEENNLKAVLGANRELAPKPFLAREYGVARYERLLHHDFAAADAYYRATKTFWAEVRAAWSSAFDATPAITLKGPVDQLGLFMPLFAQADAIAKRQRSAQDSTAAIESALRAMGALQAVSP